jgi:hypothetical protein
MRSRSRKQSSWLQLRRGSRSAKLEKPAKHVNNKPGLQLKIDKLDIVKSWLVYDDKAECIY